MVDSSYVKSLLGAQTFFNCILVLILFAVISTLVLIVIYFRKKKSDFLDDIEKLANKNCTNKQAADQTISTLKEVIKIENEKNLKMMDYMNKSLASQHLKENANQLCHNATSLNESKKHSLGNLFSFKSTHTENNLNRDDSILNSSAKIEQLKENKKSKKSFSLIHKMFKKNEADEEDSNLKLKAKPLSSRNLADFKENLKDKNENSIEIRENNEESMPCVSDIHLENLELVYDDEEVKPKMSCFKGCFKTRSKNSLIGPPKICESNSFGVADQVNLNINQNIDQINLNKSSADLSDRDSYKTSSSSSTISNDTTNFKNYIPDFKSLRPEGDPFSASLSSSSSSSCRSGRSTSRRMFKKKKKSEIKSKFPSYLKTKNESSNETIVTAQKSNLTTDSDMPAENKSKSNFSYESNWTAQIPNKLPNTKPTNDFRANKSSLIQAPIRQTDSTLSAFYESRTVSKQDSLFSGVSSVISNKTVSNFSESTWTASSQSKDGYLLPKMQIPEKISKETLDSRATNQTTTTASSTTFASTVTNASEETNMEMMPGYSKLLKKQIACASESSNTSVSSSSLSTASTVVPSKPSAKPIDSNKESKFFNSMLSVAQPESKISIGTIKNLNILSSEISNSEIMSVESSEINFNTKNNQEQTIIFKIRGKLEFN